MQGLFGSLTMAARALEAQRSGLDIAGQNISNLNTPGYARRRLALAEVTNGTGGVEVLGTQVLRDRWLDARLRQALPDEAREGAIVATLSGVETAIGAPGQALDGRLAAFFDALAALSLDPTSAVTRDGVVSQGRTMAAAFNDMAARLADSRRQADNSIRSGVDDLNALTTEIAELNVAIAGAGGVDVEALKDRQRNAVESLSKLTSVSVLARADGGVDVTIPTGRALVIGGAAYTVGVTTGLNGLATISLAGADITADLTSGQLGGLLHARDTLVPAYQSQLDALAFGVAQEVNALHQTGFDLNGAAGTAFFTPLASATGAATALAVAAPIQADPSLVAASGTGAPGDNGIATRLAALRDAKVLGGGTATMSETWAHLAYRVGNDAQAAEGQQRSRHDVTNEVERLRDQFSGVSLDEEAADMLKFQRAYEANAKFFSVVDDLLGTLMRVVGGG